MQDHESTQLSWRLVPGCGEKALEILLYCIFISVQKPEILRDTKPEQYFRKGEKKIFFPHVGNLKVSNSL